MASTRPVRLDDWGISWEEYKELSYFSLQYDQKKREAAALLTIKISTPKLLTYHKNGEEYGEFLPGGGGISDPVAATAAKRERLLNDVRMIEKAAKVAGGSIWGSLLKAVTTRGGVQSVMAKDRPPIGERQFYTMRREYFWVLREMKNGDLEPIA